MSFDALKASDVTRRKKPILLKVADKEYTFYAVEMTAVQRSHVHALVQQNLDFGSQMIIYSIVDEHGRRMVRDQLDQLAPEYIEEFLLAVFEVNLSDPIKSEPAEGQADPKA